MSLVYILHVKRLQPSTEIFMQNFQLSQGKHTIILLLQTPKNISTGSFTRKSPHKEIILIVPL